MSLSLKALLLLVVLVTTAGFSLYATPAESGPVADVADGDANVVDEPKVRTKRTLFWDFLQKTFITTNLVVDQYVDTRNTVHEIYNLINSQFSDPAPSKPTLPTTTTTTTTEAPEPDEDTEVSTTTEAYHLSRYEFGRILGRNFRGLNRLLGIELRDAFNQSHYNIEEYKAEANEQFANSLGAEKKNQLNKMKN